MEEQCHVTCGNVGCRDADDEANKAYANRSNDMPELRQRLVKSNEVDIEMWQTFSCRLSELHATRTENMHEKTHGGALINKVGT